MDSPETLVEHLTEAQQSVGHCRPAAVKGYFKQTSHESSSILQTKHNDKKDTKGTALQS